MGVPRDWMRAIARLALATALVVSISVFSWNLPVGAAEEGGGEPNIRFRWAFASMVWDGNGARLEPMGTDAELKTGDHFKMLVELQDECFVYVVYHNAQGELTMLFPYSPQQFATDYEVSKKYYIPQGDGWFELDGHTGRETFYVLASPERLTELEDLLSGYRTADTAKKPELARQILTEIRNMKTEHRDLAAPAERPVPIGGAVRGIERAQGAQGADIESFSGEITATDFYAKTYTIEHR